MDVILLCAGFGTRLENLTKNTPKGLLEVAGKPVLDYLLPQVLELPELETIHLVGNGRFFSQFYTWADRWRVRLREEGVTLHLHNDGTLQHEKRLGSVGDLAFALRAQKEPRRTLIVDAPYFRETWELSGILTGIGGTLMFAGGVLFFVVMFGTFLLGRRSTDQEIPFTETELAPATSGWEVHMDEFRYWVAVTIVLILIAYGPFLVGYLPPRLLSPGFGFF